MQFVFVALNPAGVEPCNSAHLTASSSVGSIAVVPRLSRWMDSGRQTSPYSENSHDGRNIRAHPLRTRQMLADCKRPLPCLRPAHEQGEHGRERQGPCIDNAVQSKPSEIPAVRKATGGVRLRRRACSVREANL